MKLLVLAVSMVVVSCSFSIKVPQIDSVKTKIERQMMGDYEALPESLIVRSSVRGEEEGSSPNSTKRTATGALSNQRFNLDDLDELKSLGVIGEALNGYVALLDADFHSGEVKPLHRRLAKIVSLEENSDREVIWTSLAEKSSSKGDIAGIQKSYGASRRRDAKPGHWVEHEQGKWKQVKR